MRGHTIAFIGLSDLWRAAERKLSPGADHTEIYRYLAGKRRKS